MSVAHLKRYLALFFFASVLALPVSACNTLEGAGQDVEEAGEAIEGTARENKPY